MNLEDVLRGAGEQPAPPPDPAFVRRLEARLATNPVVAHRRSRVIPAAAVLVAAAATVFVILGLRGHEPAHRVVTEPNPAITTTTVEGLTTTTTTALLPPPTTTSTTPPSTTTTEVRRVTTTTAAPAPSTTTTTAPPPQDLHLACTSDPAANTISCHWDASTDPRFASYRIIRHTGDGPDNAVYAGRDTSETSSSLKGARWFYVVTALAGDGTELGRSQTQITCC